MSAQMMQKIAPGWRRVATPRYKKDYKGKYVTAEDFSDVRSEFRKSPPDGAVCLVERRYSEGAGQEFHLLLVWRCPLRALPPVQRGGIVDHGWQARVRGTGGGEP